MQSTLVFSYGSNLDLRQMRVRCPSALVEARALLGDHALAFGGFSQRWGGAVASVIPELGSQVEGLIYRISRADLAKLDRFEGTPFAYERRAKLVLDENGRRRRAHLYRQTADQFDPWPPARKYFRVLWRAYDRLGFDQKVLAAAAGVAS